MTEELCVALAVAFGAAFLSGAVLGRALGAYAMERGLTLAPDERSGVAGPHRLAGRFWYLVPEREFCRMSAADLRARFGEPEEGPDDA